MEPLWFKYTDPAVFTGGDSIILIKLAPFPQNIIHLLHISALGILISVWNNYAAANNSTSVPPSSVVTHVWFNFIIVIISIKADLYNLFAINLVLLVE